MATKELMEYDPLTGMSLYFEWLGDGKFNLHHEEDVEPLLERNKLLQNADDYKKNGIKGGFQHVATIPNSVIMQWRKEGVDINNPNHTEAIKRKLRDPAYRYLRTTLGGI